MSNYYSHLTRHHHHHQRTPSTSLNSIPSHSVRRIFLLPKNSTDLENGIDLDLVYAPVPRHSLPKELQDQATEAWISDANPGSQSLSNSSSTSSELRNHQHHRRHHRHHSTRHRSDSPSSLTGTIKLEITPDEGLLPAYVNGEWKAS